MYAHCAQNYQAIHEVLKCVYRLDKAYQLGRDMRRYIIQCIYPAIFVKRIIQDHDDCEGPQGLPETILYKSIKPGLNAFICLNPARFFAAPVDDPNSNRVDNDVDIASGVSAEPPLKLLKLS